LIMDEAAVEDGEGGLLVSVVIGWMDKEGTEGAERFEKVVGVASPVKVRVGPSSAIEGYGRAATSNTKAET